MDIEQNRIDSETIKRITDNIRALGLDMINEAGEVASSLWK